MQTFLPYSRFDWCATVLDDRRLGKQRVECKQILNALVNGGGWSNHPAVKMWAGCEYWLCDYAIAICKGWRELGFRDSLLPEFSERILEFPVCAQPAWLGDPALHASHRSNLLRKDPEWYGQLNWPEPPDLPYHWPV